MSLVRVCPALLLPLSAIAGCGARVEPLSLEQETSSTRAGAFAGPEHLLEFSAQRTAPAAAEVELRLGSLRLDAHYDYGVGEVIIDGHGAALDRASHRLLLDAAAALGESFQPAGDGLPFEDRALYATVVVWQQSGGVPLDRLTFSIPKAEPRPPGLSTKSLLDDGIGCIRRGSSYYVSFDHGRTTVVDRVVTADSRRCNGLCGPDCVELTPWNMWTLDCLEHDTCCSAIDSTDCWTPLGECGDEYQHAMSDFLRGFDPFRRHCGG